MDVTVNISSQVNQTTTKGSSSGEVNGYYALLLALEGTTSALQGTAVVQAITTEALIENENVINNQQTQDSYEQVVTQGTVSDLKFASDAGSLTKQSNGTYIASDGDVYTQAEVTADLAKLQSDGDEALKEADAKYGTSSKYDKEKKEYISNYLSAHSVEITIVPSSSTLGQISDYNLQVQASRDYLTGLIKIDTNIGQVIAANASSTASAITQAVDNFSSDLQTMTQIVQSIFQS